MLSTSFHGCFDIQPAPSVTSPQPTHQKVKSAGGHPPLNIELDQLSFGVRYNGPADSDPKSSSPAEQQSAQSTSQPMTPEEPEMSRPPSPRAHQAVELMQAWNSPSINKWRILSCCLSFMGNGLNDADIMEMHYHISYAIMSLVFVGTAVGFITAAFFTKMILVKLGRAKSLITGELIMLTGYIILVCTPPYPLVVIAFFTLGFGAAVNLALNNVYCTSLQPTSTILGAAHGSYGVGGIIAPIMGTAIASRGILWSRFYLIPLGIRLCCMVFSGWIFWSYREEQNETLLTALEATNSRQDAVHNKPESKLHDLKMALKNSVTLMGALFIFVYQGAEVSVSGWMISFLINYRDGDPASMGYVTAGFWTGITLGRFILTHFAPMVGEKNFVVILTMGSLLLQLMAWLIPNVIGNAVAVSLLGFLLGPIYPCAQTIFSRLMPRHVLTTAVGFIVGAGSSGGAVAPFTTGILAQAAGTWVLHPVCVGLYVVMLGCWLALPRVRKRIE